MSGAVTEKYLKALDNPVVKWQHPTKGELKVLNPDINLQQFGVMFNGPPGTTPFFAIAVTPRMVMRPIRYDASETSMKDLAFIANELYKRAITKNYADGRARNYNDAVARVQFFDGWWANGSPFSGAICIDKASGERIGIVNIGSSEEGPTTADVAAIFAKQYQGDGYGTEAMLASFVISEGLKNTGFKMRDGTSEYETLSFTARKASLTVARRFELPEVGTSDVYGKDNERVVIKEQVSRLIALLENSRERDALLAQQAQELQEKPAATFTPALAAKQNKDQQTEHAVKTEPEQTKLAAPAA